MAHRYTSDRNKSQTREELSLSVIVPFYNAGKTLKKCLDSVKVSAYPGYELIAVDDGSTDNSAEIAEQIGCKIIKTGKKHGAAYARNMGAQHAQHSILVFLDADVVLKSKDILSKIAARFRDPKTQCINGIYASEPANKGNFFCYRALQDHFWVKDITKADYFTPACGAIRKQLFQELGGFDTSYSGADVEDFEFGYRVTAKTTIQSIPNIEVYHHFSGLKTCSKNYFRRASLWTKLYFRRKKFDNLGSTRRNGVSFLAGCIAIVLLFAAVVTMALPILWASLTAMIIFIGGHAPFFAYVRQMRGNVFTLYAMYNHLLLSVPITLGAVAGLLDHSTSTPKRLLRNIGQAAAIAKPFITRYPAYMILYVTNKCNSKCKTCFYWDSLNKPNNELSLEEIQKIAKKYKQIVQLTLTGGEPTLRKELPEIVEAFAKYSNLKFVTIPTNGLLPDRIAQLIERCVQLNPGVDFTIPLSLDGLHHAHDEIRGVPGNFDRLVETHNKLKRLEQRYPNIKVDVNTVVHKFNQHDVEKIFAWVEKNLEVRNHGVCFTRGNPLDKETKNLSLERLKEIAVFIEDIKTKKQRDVKRRKNWVGKLFDGIAMLTNDLAIWSIVNDKFKHPCLAGRKLIIMGETGTVYPCEILPGTYTMGNIRDFDYDILKLIHAKQGQRVNAFIKQNKCGACTFECALAANIVYDPRYWPALLQKVIKVYRGGRYEEKKSLSASVVPTSSATVKHTEGKHEALTH